MSYTVPNRSEIPVTYKWNIESVFPTFERWKTAVQLFPPQLSRLKPFVDQLDSSPELLIQCLETATDLFQQIEKIYLYAVMNYTVETNNQEAGAQMGQASSLMGQLLAASSFIQPELIKIGFDQLAQWETVNPALKKYNHYFDSIKKQAPHVRSAEVEELLGQLADPFSTATATHGILANSELKIKPANNEIEITHGTLNSLIMSPDRETRKSAWENYADAHLSFKNTMSNALSVTVKQNLFNAKARNYTSALEASVAQDFLPTEVFHNTINAFKNNLSIWHRYWALRKKILGLTTLYPYDLKSPLAGKKPTISFDQAIDWICAGMAPLGEEYVATMRRGVYQERWVDIYPNKHKTSGAFSTGAHGCQPFILMSYTDDIESLSTLAHELGHSMHTHYSNTNQPHIYAEYTIFAAEVASNFNQALVRDYLLKTQPDPLFQIAILEEAMSNFYRYFFLMPTLARFELGIHEHVAQGESLTADYMNNFLADLFAEGYGSEISYDRDRVGITWAMFHTHLYSNFYVYKYTTGIAGAHSLAYDLLSGEMKDPTPYLQFLKAGSSRYPLDALKMAGVDLSSSEPVEKTFTILSKMIDQLENAVNQLN